MTATPSALKMLLTPQMPLILATALTGSCGFYNLSNDNLSNDNLSNDNLQLTSQMAICNPFGLSEVPYILN